MYYFIFCARKNGDVRATIEEAGIQRPHGMKTDRIKIFGQS